MPHGARQAIMTKVPGRNVGYAISDRLDDPCRFVPQQEREFVIDSAFPVVKVGVAHPASLHPHERLSRTWIGHEYVLERDRGPN